MAKKYSIDTMLLSPKVSLIVDRDMAINMLDHLDDMVSQPSRELELPHGKARSWGVEMAHEGQPDRAYRVAFVIEEKPPPTGATYLTLIAIEEGIQLELPPDKRMALSDWTCITPGQD